MVFLFWPPHIQQLAHYCRIYALILLHLSIGSSNQTCQWRTTGQGLAPTLRQARSGCRHHHQQTSSTYPKGLFRSGATVSGTTTWGSSNTTWSGTIISEDQACKSPFVQSCICGTLKTILSDFGKDDFPTQRTCAIQRWNYDFSIQRRPAWSNWQFPWAIVEFAYWQGAPAHGTATTTRALCENITQTKRHVPWKKEHTPPWKLTNVPRKSMVGRCNSQLT